MASLAAASLPADAGSAEMDAARAAVELYARRLKFASMHAFGEQMRGVTRRLVGYSAAQHKHMLRAFGDAYLFACLMPGLQSELRERVLAAALDTMFDENQNPNSNPHHQSHAQQRNATQQLRIGYGMSQSVSAYSQIQRAVTVSAMNQSAKHLKLGALLDLELSVQTLFRIASDAFSHFAAPLATQAFQLLERIESVQVLAGSHDLVPIGQRARHGRTSVDDDGVGAPGTQTQTELDAAAANGAKTTCAQEAVDESDSNTESMTGPVFVKRLLVHLIDMHKPEHRNIIQSSLGRESSSLSSVRNHGSCAPTRTERSGAAAPLNAVCLVSVSHDVILGCARARDDATFVKDVWHALLDWLHFVDPVDLPAFVYQLLLLCKDLDVNMKHSGAAAGGGMAGLSNVTSYKPLIGVAKGSGLKKADKLAMRKLLIDSVAERFTKLEVASEVESGARRETDHRTEGPSSFGRLREQLEREEEPHAIDEILPVASAARVCVGSSSISSRVLQDIQATTLFHFDTFCTQDALFAKCLSDLVSEPSSLRVSSGGSSTGTLSLTCSFGLALLICFGRRSATGSSSAGDGTTSASGRAGIERSSSSWSMPAAAPLGMSALQELHPATKYVYAAYELALTDYLPFVDRVDAFLMSVGDEDDDSTGRGQGEHILKVLEGRLKEVAARSSSAGAWAHLAPRIAQLALELVSCLPRHIHMNGVRGSGASAGSACVLQQPALARRVLVPRLRALSRSLLHILLFNANEHAQGFETGASRSLAAANAEQQNQICAEVLDFCLYRIVANDGDTQFCSELAAEILGRCATSTEFTSSNHLEDVKARVTFHLDSIVSEKPAALRRFVRVLYPLLAAELYHQRAQRGRHSLDGLNQARGNNGQLPTSGSGTSRSFNASVCSLNNRVLMLARKCQFHQDSAAQSSATLTLIEYCHWYENEAIASVLDVHTKQARLPERVHAMSPRSYPVSDLGALVTRMLNQHCSVREAVYLETVGLADCTSRNRNNESVRATTAPLRSSATGRILRDVLAVKCADYIEDDSNGSATSSMSTRFRRAIGRTQMCVLEPVGSLLQAALYFDQPVSQGATSEAGDDHDTGRSTSDMEVRRFDNGAGYSKVGSLALASTRWTDFVRVFSLTPFAVVQQHQQQSSSSPANESRDMDQQFYYRSCADDDAARAAASLEASVLLGVLDFLLARLLTERPPHLDVAASLRVVNMHAILLDASAKLSNATAAASAATKRLNKKDGDGDGVEDEPHAKRTRIGGSGKGKGKGKSKGRGLGTDRGEDSGSLLDTLDWSERVALYAGEDWPHLFSTLAVMLSSGSNASLTAQNERAHFVLLKVIDAQLKRRMEVDCSDGLCEDGIDHIFKLSTGITVPVFHLGEDPQMLDGVTSENHESGLHTAFQALMGTFKFYRRRCDPTSSRLEARCGVLALECTKKLFRVALESDTANGAGPVRDENGPGDQYGAHAGQYIEKELRRLDYVCAAFLPPPMRLQAGRAQDRTVSQGAVQSQSLKDNQRLRMNAGNEDAQIACGGGGGQVAVRCIEALEELVSNLLGESQWRHAIVVLHMIATLSARASMLLRGAPSAARCVEHAIFESERLVWVKNHFGSTVPSSTSSGSDAAAATSIGCALAELMINTSADKHKNLVVLHELARALEYNFGSNNPDAPPRAAPNMLASSGVLSGGPHGRENCHAILQSVMCAASSAAQQLGNAADASQRRVLRSLSSSTYMGSADDCVLTELRRCHDMEAEMYVRMELVVGVMVAALRSLITRVAQIEVVLRTTIVVYKVLLKFATHADQRLKRSGGGSAAKKGSAFAFEFQAAFGTLIEKVVSELTPATYAFMSFATSDAVPAGKKSFIRKESRIFPELVCVLEKLDVTLLRTLGSGKIPSLRSHLSGMKRSTIRDFRIDAHALGRALQDDDEDELEDVGDE
ncbi:hypothetical protein FVE85_3540 [Porphyridium purpureum]|uniref:FANCI solenoid 4 domain-containing protein n=1 Tax=Porphyridium purpureum TaxID=35688 RepID=A0A5J4YM54_PORPP|nr:hypothetical protein FVE85_3540 [Porphyridium purpureum]|eukprot:POR7526..scf249_10